MVITALYAVALLVPAALALISRGRLRAGRPGSATSLEEVALLAGGPARVGDLVIARMLARGQTRLNSLGRLYRTPRRPGDELSQAAWAATTPDGARRAVARHPEVRALAAELAGRGLLLDPRRPWAIPFLGYAVLSGLGVGYVAKGEGPGAGVLLAVSVVAAIVCGTLAVRRRPGEPTAAGREALGAAEVHGPLGAVALGGLAAHPDSAIRRAAQRKGGDPMAGARRTQKEMLRGPTGGGSGNLGDTYGGGYGGG